MPMLAKTPTLVLMLSLADIEIERATAADRKVRSTSRY